MTTLSSQTSTRSMITTVGAVLAAAAAAVAARVLYEKSKKKTYPKRPLVYLSKEQGTPAEIVKVLRRDGAVIVQDVVPADEMDRLSQDVLALSDWEYSGAASSFAGQYTRRCGPYIMSHSQAARNIVAHPLHVAVSNLLLVPATARRIRLSVAACIRVLAGHSSPPQVLHRDDDEWPLALLGNIKPGLEVECSAMWAVTDFRKSNGATNVVVGSQGGHDPTETPPALEDCQQAVMSTGSVLFFTGSVWHGTGGASSDSEADGTPPSDRMGFLVQHISSFLYPEYNLHFAVDPKVASSQTFADTPHLKSLLGFDGPDLYPKANLPGPVYATEYTGYPDREDADFSAPLPGGVVVAAPQTPQ